MTMTIKELADELGVKKYIVKYQVEKLSEEHLDNSSNVIRIKPKGIALIRSSLGGEDAGEKPNNRPEKVNNDSSVTLLVEELNKKNKQIEELHDLLKNQNKLLDQQQQLTLQANIKIKELETTLTETEVEEDIQTEPSEETIKKSFWYRLFH